jgi:adenine-specific DNA methylase
MIPKECKRLAEVDFPISVVSKHAVREKSIRHGHPSTLHLWWARRPLAACRAMLLALLLPDPCDPACPAEFKKRARTLLLKVRHTIGPKDQELRQALLKFIGDFANWDLSADRTYLEVSRGLVKAAHGEETPLVVDPFAGGGSIPLEALRLGCETFASDLNPVACLILKVMLEDIPRHGPELAEGLRRLGAEVKQAAGKELGEFYPDDPDGARPIAYLWARTVQCEAPNCGAEIPLARSFWLCKKANRRRTLLYRVIRPKGETPRVEFQVFEPKTESEVSDGTVNRAKANCPCCNMILSPDRVRAQLAAQRGGADVIFDNNGQRTGGARLLAVVTLKPGEQGRHYRLPTEPDYQAVWKASKSLERVTAAKLPNGLSPVPDEPLPPIGTLGFRVQRYGMLQWGDLFTARQKLAFVTLASTIRSVVGAQNLQKLQQLLAMVCTKLADRNNSLVNWSLGVECPNQLFKGTALPMGWDFCESNILSDSSASVDQSIDNIARNTLASYIQGTQPSSPQLADACESILPDQSASVWFTDPPYYDAVPYSDLSDFFFVWLKRGLPDHPLLHDPFDLENGLTPKTREIVQDETKSFGSQLKGRTFFEEAMARAFTRGRRVLKEDGVGSVVFAHKTTEGWEALLSGMIRGGWVITGSWPIATERYSRFRARDSAALATSVHLVCRPRPKDAPVGDWSLVLHELPRRMADWMERLQGEGVRGADLVFACIGPALEIYSRYSKVVDAEERVILLGGDPEATEPHKRGFLAYVWEVVGRTALEQVLGTAEARARNSLALSGAEGAAGALEEDARLTALFLWTLQSTNGAQANEGAEESGEESEEDEKEEASPRKKPGFSLIFDVVRRFAQPLGIHLPEWEGRIIETTKGVVRLLPVGERSRQLFGEEGASAVADRIERTPTGQVQLNLFGESGVEPEIRGRGRGRKKAAANVGDEALRTHRDLPAAVQRQAGATTLDRVHAAMLLQAGGRTNALRALLEAEQQRGPDFLRLANALSALYPRDSEEKRLLDAMLLAVPR